MCAGVCFILFSFMETCYKVPATSLKVIGIFTFKRKVLNSEYDPHSFKNISVKRVPRLRPMLCTMLERYHSGGERIEKEARKCFINFILNKYKRERTNIWF